MNNSVALLRDDRQRRACGLNVKESSVCPRLDEAVTKFKSHLLNSIKFWFCFMSHKLVRPHVFRAAWFCAFEMSKNYNTHQFFLIESRCPLSSQNTVSVISLDCLVCLSKMVSLAFSLVNLSFTRAQTLLQHFHPLCLWVFDPQYSS